MGHTHLPAREQECRHPPLKKSPEEEQSSERTKFPLEDKGRRNIQKAKGTFREEVEDIEDFPDERE